MLRTASLVASRAAAHQHAHPALGAARGLAKKAKPSGKPGGASDAAKATKAAAGASNQVIGTNILKDGQDAELRPYSEYPDWVWTLHEPLPSLETLMARQQARVSYKLPREVGSIDEPTPPLPHQKARDPQRYPAPRTVLRDEQVGAAG